MVYALCASPNLTNMTSPAGKEPARKASKSRGRSPAARASPNKVAAEIIGRTLRTYWPNEGWFSGTVQRYVPSSGKYEAKYSDGSLVLLSAKQIKEYSVPSSSVPTQPSVHPKDQSSHEPSAPAPKSSQVGYNGVVIVVLSALLSAWLAVTPEKMSHLPLDVSGLMTLGILPPDGALNVSARMCFGNVVLCLLFSWIYAEYSWTDRLWSVVPFFYALFFAYDSEWDPRCTLMAVLTLAWCLRLSYNFARKGGYKIGEQDYRWPWLQGKILEFSPRFYRPVWELFNITFIAYYQHVLLHLLAIPSFFAAGTRRPLMWLDAVAATLFLTALVLETLADEQQWAFQREKHHQRARRGALRGDYANGFLTHGLFAYSRHPNFFGEQLLWVAFYLFSVAALYPEPQWVNKSGAGALLLILLFQGSTRVTEVISSSKYPGYANYQQRVSMLLPLPL
jgi:steroid 5-alpha reductase family enzyme